MAARPTTHPPGYIGTDELAERTNVTRRQLDEWRSRNLIFPAGPRHPGRGRAVVWREADVELVRTLGRVTRAFGERGAEITILRHVRDRHLAGWNYVDLGHGVKLSW